MRIVPRSSIIIRDRQRKKAVSPSELNELKESIGGKCLLSPPVCFELEGDTHQFLLIAGETRTKAIDLLAKERRTFSCDNQTIKPGEMPIILCGLEDLLTQKEVELDENILRHELDWKDRAQALADIHAMRIASNPSQTQRQTAEELITKGGGGAVGVRGVNSMRETIRNAVLIAPHLNNPAIANARNLTEARQLVLKQEQERAHSILAQRALKSGAQKIIADCEVRNGDLLIELPKIDGNQFDLLLSDPPYGINATGGGFRSRTIHHHNYDDTPEYAKKLLLCILTESFRLTKQRANLFLFTDIDNWDWLQRVSAQIGWTPFRRPLIWGKSDSEGLAPWGAKGPRITTDFIFFATKGQKGLLASPIDYLRVNRVARNERLHAAEKPVELLTKLIECSTLPGDRILDPCCGSGSTLIAARECGRRALGIERDEAYYNTAMSNVYMRKDKVNVS